ncbi:MAG: O-antigen ligase family protein [Rhodomicrobium sp.]
MAVILTYQAFVVLSWRRSIIDPSTRRVRVLLKLLLVLAIVACYSSFVQGFTVYRVIYGAISYIGFMGALAFATTVVTEKRRTQFLRLTVALGVVSCLGLLLDYETGWFDFLPHQGGTGIDEQLALGDLRRASFLFAAPTVVYPFISFSLVAAAILVVLRPGLISSSGLILLLFIAPISIFFTGSRAQFFLAAGFAFAISIILIRQVTKGVLVSLILTFVLVFPAIVAAGIKVQTPDIPQLSMLIDRYGSGSFEKDAEGNDERYEEWARGLDLFVEAGGEFFTGIGICSSCGMVDDGRIATSHYESTLFQAFSEAGIVGLVVRFYPGVLAIIVLIYRSRLEWKLRVILVLWFAFYFLSVGTSPTAGMYHTQFIYFTAVGLALQMRSIGLDRQEVA